MKKILRIRLTLAGLAVLLFTFSASAQGIYINEVLADNKTAFDDGDGGFPDYVELFNTNTVDVSIASWRLTTDLTQPNMYIFPANTVIPARGFLLIICDEQSNKLYHTSFKLGKKGETVSLLGPALGLRDSVRFGFQVTDRSFGRVPDGNGVHQLCRPTPGAPNVNVPLGNRQRLRFNEWLPSNDTKPDWFEIYNPETNPVSLALLVFSDRTNILTQCTNKATPTNSWLEAGGFLRFNCDDKPNEGNDELDFKLASAGELASPPDRLVLFSQNRSNIFHLIRWTNAQTFVSEGFLPDGDTNNRVVFGINRDTPGESNFLPIDNIYVNEVLAHTDLPLEDAIELYNAAPWSTNIGGWWLSNSKDTYNKYRIPANTIIPAGGYKVFYEYVGVPGGFNPTGDGIAPSFTLNSALGDQVYIFTANATGKLLGYRRGVDFPATQNGQSYGRYITSTGESDFVPLERLTFGTSVTASDPPSMITTFRTGQGAPNPGPSIGPLIVNEIMYHPPDIISGTNVFDNELDEYVEIYNITTQPVRLYDTNVYEHIPYGMAYTNTWRLRGDIGFEFPTNITLGAGRSLLVVNFGLTNTIQLNTFRNKYSVPPGVQIFGAYRGKLSNGGGVVEIERPDAPQGPGREPYEGYAPYLRVDRVHYDDLDPWPPEADGIRINPGSPNSLGYVLARKKPERYGGEPTNWVAAIPSAGRQLISNSVVCVEGVVTMSFEGLAGSGYTIQYRDELSASTWGKLQDMAPQTTSGPRSITFTPPPGTRRFYRVVTPIQP